MMIFPFKTVLTMTGLATGLATALAAAFMAMPAYAQDRTEPESPQLEVIEPNGRGENIPQAPIDERPLELNLNDLDSVFEGEPGESLGEESLPFAPRLLDIPNIDMPEMVDPALETAAPPDYSRLPESMEREAKLKALFERLGASEDEEAANLIAEEIWAIWLDSGSQSVNLLMRRGNAAHKRGNKALARRMYNHVTALSPDYAEGWARSARLALEEEDFSRALSEVTQALILEPRQFYAHWTLGNLFERVGRTEPAYEAYKEAARLYPELKAVKDRLKLMKGNLEGDVL